MAELTRFQMAALGCNRGLIEPGACDSCKKDGPRLKFYNPYADPVVQHDLCPKCMGVAVRSVELYLRTRWVRHGVQR